MTSQVRINHYISEGIYNIYDFEISCNIKTLTIISQMVTGYCGYGAEETGISFVIDLYCIKEQTVLFSPTWYKLAINLWEFMRTSFWWSWAETMHLVNCLWSLTGECKQIMIQITGTLPFTTRLQCSYDIPVDFLVNILKKFCNTFNILWYFSVEFIIYNVIKYWYVIKLLQCFGTSSPFGN